MGKNDEGAEKEPPCVLWPDRSGGSCQLKQPLAGAMIAPEVVHSKSLFSLLYEIDLDLAKRTQARRCPFAGGLCIAATTRESLEVAPLTLKRLLRFVSACAVGVRAAGAGCCPPLCVSGGAGSTGLR